MATYKALDTPYGGYLFRSILEARWAVFFDQAGIEYVYEPQGYDLGGIWYLPDFWLPQVQMHAEVKPGNLNARETEKIRRLVEMTGHGALELVGDPDCRSYWGWWLWEPPIASTLCRMEFVLLPWYIQNEHRLWFEPAGSYVSGADFPIKYHNAVRAARSARFGIHEAEGEVLSLVSALAAQEVMA